MTLISTEDCERGTKFNIILIAPKINHVFGCVLRYDLCAHIVQYPNETYEMMVYGRKKLRIPCGTPSYVC